MDNADRCSVNSLREIPGCSPVEGVVRWDPLHSLWNGGMLAGALLLAPLFFSWSAVFVFLVLTGASLLLGHSVGVSSSPDPSQLRLPALAGARSCLGGDVRRDERAVLDDPHP